MEKDYIKKCMLEKDKINITSISIADGYNLITYANKKGEVSQRIALYYANDELVWYDVVDLPHHLKKIKRDNFIDSKM